MSIKNLVAGLTIGYAVGSQKANVTPNVGAGATEAELRAALAQKEDEKHSLQLQLEALGATSQATIVTLSEEIEQLELDIAALQTQIANSGGAVKCSRETMYAGGVETGITNSAGAVTLAGWTLVNAAVSAGTVPRVTTTGSASFGWLGTPANNLDLRTVVAPSKPARGYTLAQETLLLFTGTAPVRASKLSMLLVEFSSQSNLAYLKRNATCTGCGVVMWIRKNVACFLVTPDANGFFACGFLMPPASSITITDGPIIDIVTISNAITPYEVVVTRASLLAMPDSYDRAAIDLPNAILSQDGFVYVRLNHELPMGDVLLIQDILPRTNPIKCYGNRPANVNDQIGHNTWNIVQVCCTAGLILS